MSNQREREDRVIFITTVIRYCQVLLLLLIMERSLLLKIEQMLIVSTNSLTMYIDNGFPTELV